VVENQKDPLLKEGHPLKELELQNLKPDLVRQNRLAYLAGLFDGEGSFGLWSVGKNRKTPQFTLQVEMRDIDLIGRFQEFFGCGTIAYRPPRQKHHSATHVWRCKGKQGLRCAQQMLIFWGEKRTVKMQNILMEVQKKYPHLLED